MRPGSTNDINEVHIQNLTAVLLLPVFFALLNVLLHQFAPTRTPLITALIYFIVLAVILLRVRIIEINDLLLLIMIYVLFGLNYFLFIETRPFIISTDMLVVLFFYLPISVFSVSKIRDWKTFFYHMNKASIVAITIGLIIVIFLDYRSYLNYMAFSYALLPFICVLYRTFRIEGRIEYLILFIAGISVILMHGSRAAILFAILYALLYELTNTSRKQKKKLCTLILSALVLCVTYLNLGNIAGLLLRISTFENSYFLRRVVRGELIVSSGRSLIYEACRNRLSTMGFSISGFFGDRAYVLEHAYPHNFIYEVLMSYGWVLGIITLIAFFALMIKGLKNKVVRSIVVFFAVTIFARYIISGSYLIEGKFWVGLFALISLARVPQKTLKLSKEVI